MISDNAGNGRPSVVRGSSRVGFDFPSLAERLPVGVDFSRVLLNRMALPVVLALMNVSSIDWSSTIHAV